MLEVNHSKIKETNRKKILSLLLNNSEITKLDISKALNISITTVSSNIVQLKAEGFVEEVGSSESTGGRKAVIIKLNENCRFSIGIALTPRHIKVYLVNLKNKVIDAIRVRHSNYNIEDIIHGIEENIEEILRKNNVNKEQLLGIGISIPGTVDSDEGIIKYCYLLGLNNVNIKARLKHIGVPIYVDNEANLSAYYETLNDNGNIDNLLYLSITDGVGLGVIIDKNIYRGSNNTSGEVGHMKINIGGKPCKCGARGCLEAYTSKKVILDIYNEKARSKITDIEEFEQLYCGNDEIAKEVLREYIETLGIGICNLVMLLDPSSIVIGGDINNILKDEINYLKEIVYRENVFSSENNCVIRVANNKEAYVLGASMRPLQEFLLLK